MTGVGVRRRGQLPAIDEEVARDEYRHRFLSLALEAFRREEISHGKLAELASMIGVGDDALAELLDRTGLGSSDESSDVLLPVE